MGGMGERRKRVVVLGVTGSIGGSALEVVRAHPGELELVGVAANRDGEGLAAVVREFGVGHASLSDPEAAERAAREAWFPSGCVLHGGAEGLTELATLPEADLVLVAVVGTAALGPTLAALERGTDIALASKEILVLGGEHVVAAARRSGARLLPTDSEHNALFQCLHGNPPDHIDRLHLTASGGRFRDWPAGDLARVTPEQAVEHPNWSMGPKITVDSATMANKGLELIEAHWLFGLPSERLEVVLHPQSIVHSMVQWIDGSIFAQLSPPSMTFAIQHCLFYPDRAPAPRPTLDFAEALQLEFRPLPPGRYPCFELARQALEQGGPAPGVFNAANEEAVSAFLAGRLSFPGISRVVEEALEGWGGRTARSLEDLLAVEAEARAAARARCA